MALSLLLQSLLEASGKKGGNDTKTAEDDDMNMDDPLNMNEEDTDNADNEGTDKDAADDNKDDPTDENQDDEDEKPDDENDQDNGEDDQKPDDDDFSLDDAGEDDENPDGLVDPDDDGSGDDMGDEDAEVNVHTNILQLSKLDRTLAKRKCFYDYQDLRSSITSFRNVIEDHEAQIDPTVRDYTLSELDSLYSNLTDYLTYKFSYINYEENLQNYMVFMAKLNKLINYVRSGGKEQPKELTVKKQPKPKKKKAPKKEEPKSEVEEEPEDTGTEEEPEEETETEESEEPEK